MDRCDALIVGGGPAGSTCAWKLRQAGLDVVVMDAAVFPRDKLCAGWITPPVVAELDLDPEAYRQGAAEPHAPGGRTFQSITGFRVGLIGGRDEVATRYGRPVSFGIRRCELDHYLLQRSGARLRLGDAVTSLHRTRDEWVVNGAIQTPMLVGAGGHFCPVSRSINGPTNTAPVVVAQEAEFPIDPGDRAAFAIDGETPELYFCRDLKGYGWCFRKERHLNIGLGRLDRQSLPAATAEFVAFLVARGRISPLTASRCRGHAYAVYGSSNRRVVDPGVVLAGDAAGLAYPESGEGIRPAIESGLLAAVTIIEAGGRYTGDRLQPYEDRLQARFGTGLVSRALSRMLPAGFGTSAARRLLEMPAFVRHVVLDRWFLHARDAALTTR